MSNSALGDNPRPGAKTSRGTRVATTSKEKPPACFFLSGAAGLVYQVIWVRLIEKVIGSAPFAVAAVLSVFMTGLALGSWRAGRVIDRQPGRATGRSTTPCWSISGATRRQPWPAAPWC